MMNIEFNKTVWDGKYDWKQKGEEWSQSWNNLEAQRFGSLYPWLHRYLPCKNLLEMVLYRPEHLYIL